MGLSTTLKTTVTVSDIGRLQSCRRASNYYYYYYCWVQLSSFQEARLIKFIAILIIFIISFFADPSCMFLWNPWDHLLPVNRKQFILKEDKLTDFCSHELYKKSNKLDADGSIQAVLYLSPSVFLTLFLWLLKVLSLIYHFWLSLYNIYLPDNATIDIHVKCWGIEWPGKVVQPVFHLCSGRFSWGWISSE